MMEKLGTGRFLINYCPKCKKMLNWSFLTICRKRYFFWSQLLHYRQSAINLNCSPNAFIWNVRTSCKKLLNLYLLKNGTIFWDKGTYFGQNFQFFPPPRTNTCQFLPCFVTPTSLKIFMVSIKWRDASKIFSISNTKLREKSCKWREAPKNFH